LLFPLRRESLEVNKMLKMKRYYVYILTNKNHTVLYVGMTNNLKTRIKQHQSKENSGFTKKYDVHKLVYFEKTQYVNNAIKREKQIKHWRRQ
jgi:putative endonuclease